MKEHEIEALFYSKAFRKVRLQYALKFFLYDDLSIKALQESAKNLKSDILYRQNWDMSDLSEYTKQCDELTVVNDMLADLLDLDEPYDIEKDLG